MTGGGVEEDNAQRGQEMCHSRQVLAGHQSRQRWPESHRHAGQKVCGKGGEGVQVSHEGCCRESGELEVGVGHCEQRCAEAQPEGGRGEMVGELGGICYHPRRHGAHGMQFEHQELFAEFGRHGSAKDFESPPPPVRILGPEVF